MSRETGSGHLKNLFVCFSLFCVVIWLCVDTGEYLYGRSFDCTHGMQRYTVDELLALCVYDVAQGRGHDSLYLNISYGVHVYNV